VKNIYPEVAIPEELDLRPGLLSIRHQGSYGTCAAQTAACMKEWQEAKDLDLRSLENRMSPQFVYNNRPNAPDEGMFGRDVMDILHKKGICQEKDYPYGSSRPITLDIYEKASNFVVDGYARIDTVDELKKALYKNGPCYIAVPVYNHGSTMWKPDIGEIRLGGHAMAVVGYNCEGFIIRNSWGIEWGDKGYTIFPYEDWGLHWECWSTVDAKSMPLDEKPKKRSIFKKFWSTVKYIFTFGKYR